MEFVVMENLECVIEQVQFLWDKGVNFVIDDFGIGYFFFVYLICMLFDVFKIDMSFVWNMMIDLYLCIVVEIILVMVKLLKLEMVVEGVEIVEQMIMFKVQGVILVQGFLFG